MRLPRHLVNLLLAAGAAVGSFVASAQEFPTRPVRYNWIARAANVRLD